MTIRADKRKVIISMLKLLVIFNMSKALAVLNVIVKDVLPKRWSFLE